MSTENNKSIYDNSIKILTDLISFETISGEDNNSLINYCDNILKKIGASSFRTFDDDKKQCVEGFTKLISNTAFSSRKDPVSYRQTNGSEVKPYSANSRTFSSV